MKTTDELLKLCDKVIADHEQYPFRGDPVAEEKLARALKSLLTSTGGVTREEIAAAVYSAHRTPHPLQNPPYTSDDLKTADAIISLLSRTGTPDYSAPVAAPRTLTPECHGLDTPERVRFYEHDFYVLSNFSAFKVCFNGIDFNTSEEAYHFQRFAGDGIRTAIRNEHIAALLRCRSAHEAFRYAQEHKRDQRPEWDHVKVPTMLQILRAKAEQHEYVRRKLLATGDRELVEDSWRDDFWGWGPNQDGQNMLGKLWMEIRAELRADRLAPSPKKEG